MKTKNDILIGWLKDAHAMESNVINMLGKQAKHLAAYPVVQQRIAEHIEESKGHAEAIEMCLKSIGSNTSLLKEGIAKLSGNMGPGILSISADEPVKAILADIATEHFEISCYESLRAAAEQCGEPEIASLAESILQEEEDMAVFLEEHLTEMAISFIENETRTTVV